MDLFFGTISYFSKKILGSKILELKIFLEQFLISQKNLKFQILDFFSEQFLISQKNLKFQKRKFCFFGIISYFPKKQLVFLRRTFGKKGVKGSVLFFWNLRKFQGIKDFVWGIKVFSGELRFFSGIKVFSGELRFFLFKENIFPKKTIP